MSDPVVPSIPAKPIEQMTAHERAIDRIYNSAGSLSMKLITPQCHSCEWFDYAHPEIARCRVFQDGIPLAILTNKADHRFPYPGDQGFRFQPKMDQTPIDGTPIE